MELSWLSYLRYWPIFFGRRRLENAHADLSSFMDSLKYAGIGVGVGDDENRNNNANTGNTDTGSKEEYIAAQNMLEKVRNIIEK